MMMSRYLPTLLVADMTVGLPASFPSLLHGLTRSHISSLPCWSRRDAATHGGHGEGVVQYISVALLSPYRCSLGMLWDVCTTHCTWYNRKVGRQAGSCHPCSM
jgi:hypothetical protein